MREVTRQDLEVVMERPAGLIPFVFVSLLAGGALVPHLTSGASEGQTAGRPDDRKSAADRGGAPLSDPGVEPLIDRLAEFFRLDVGEADLIRDTPDQLSRLTSASPSGDGLTKAESAQFVRCFFDLDLAVSPSELQTFHEVLRPFGSCSHPQLPNENVRTLAAARVAPFVGTYGERERPIATQYSRNAPAETKAHVKTLLDEVSATARRTMAFLKVRAASRTYFNGGVQFIIATVPDPIDSHAGWQFDPAMAAIEEAAGANEFVLDRFYFPDADTSAPTRPGATAAPTALHESQPGVVLFRSTAKPLDPASPLVQSLTVVFVVTETPTAGINGRAFAAAVRSVSSWDSAPVEARRPLLILGPYFSGTSHSMALALTELKTDIGDRDVRIISGSATGDLNKETLERAFTDSGAAPHPHIEFHATVQPDAVITKTIVYYIAKEFDSQIYEGRPRIARLLESNTSYGIGITARPDDHDDEPEYIDLHFPLHISRLRSDGRDRGKAAPAPAIGIVPRFRPLALGDESRPTDQLPIFTPQTTTAYVELVLSHILDTIRRERIHIIGIMATDARDKLFLAREISRDVPNAILYTTESDMLYVHPDFLHATDGMLIASPYPLYSRDRIVTNGTRHERRQFATSSVEGVYNAMLALMKYRAAGPPLAVPIDPQLVDYVEDSGECHKCGPPVWISVVGRGTAFPLAASRDFFSSGPAGYLWPSQAAAGNNDHPAPDPDAKERTRIPASTQLLFFGMIALVAAHMIRAPRVPKDPARDLYVAAASICLLIAWLPVSFIALKWIDEVQGGRLWMFAAIAFALVGAALAYLIVARLIRGRDLLRRRAGWVVGIGVAAWAAVSLVQWLRHPFSETALFAELFVERVTAVTDGVSPAVPVFGLSAALYLWALIELRRLARPKILPAEGYDYLESMVDGSLQSLPCGLDNLKRSILSVPAPAVAALAAGAIVALSAAGFDPYWSPLRSMDGPDFGRFVTLLLTTVQLMIVAALFQFLHIWLAIAAMLERLATLPTAGAYKRLPRKLFPQNVLPRVPRLSELQEAVRRWDHLEHEDTLPHISTNVTDVFRDDMKRNPHQFWSQTNTWKAVLLEARRVLDELSVRGMVSSMAVTYPKLVPLSSIGGVGSLDSLPSATRSELFAVSQVATDDLHRFRQEEFVVLPIVYMIRAALARMWDNVLFVIGAILLLLGVHASYPFQLNRRLEGFLWTDVAVGVAAVLFVFVRMERDEVLSNIRSSTPGQIKWDRDFIVKLVVYGLIPVAGLFAAEFPDIGGAVLSWIQPFQKALP
jgi:hypothetical protein